MTGEMEAFLVHFPDIAKEQTRSVTVGEDKDNPPGQYAFIELYCSEKNCDCRNVMVNVVERSRGHLATINHALDPDGFKDIGLPRTHLDILNRQSREAPALLKLFKKQLRDKDYAGTLDSHYMMVKAKVDKSNPIFLKIMLDLFRRSRPS